MKLFLRFQQVGVTVLIVTHDIALIERMGHRRLILDHGTLPTAVRALVLSGVTMSAPDSPKRQTANAPEPQAGTNTKSVLKTVLMAGPSNTSWWLLKP